MLSPRAKNNICLLLAHPWARKPDCSRQQPIINRACAASLFDFYVYVCTGDPSGGGWGESLMLQEFEWELMPVMVRVEKFKNLQNKACLPSLLCYLLCPGYFGGDSFFCVCVCVWLWDSKSPPLWSPVMCAYILCPKDGFLFFLNYFFICTSGIHERK